MLGQLWQASGLYQLTGGQAVMLGVSLLLLYLGIVKKFEPLLLVTIGFGPGNHAKALMIDDAVVLEGEWGWIEETLGDDVTNPGL